MARQPGLSKSSVHRLQHALERRTGHPASWLWEPEVGRQWLTRLVGAPLSTFGRKRGGGMDTMPAFCARLHLEPPVGCAPTACRRGRQAVEAAWLETAAAWEQEGGASGEGREVRGAGDAPFLERLRLVCLALAPGYLLLDEGADDRTYPPWKALGAARLTGLGTGGLDGGSDRAKARRQLAEQGLECLSMPDVFQGIPESVPRSALAMGQRWRHAQQERRQATAVLARRQGPRQAEHTLCAARAPVEARQAEVTRGKEAFNR